MKKMPVFLSLAAVLWFVMFSPWTKHMFNFWITMSVSALALIGISITQRREIPKQFKLNLKAVALGLLSAAALWVIFYFGDLFSASLFDFARPQVEGIYALKEGQSKTLIAIGLLLIIGPAEEIFWRGYVQHSLIERYGEWTALIVTASVYTLVHIWSFNFMLIMAALVCGLFWGVMYRYNKNLVPIVISHAVWDATVFILFPVY
ncbi:MAG: CPBP family intramembrane metalloprotease [Dysgonamonadaceae bacterium]|jgi:membrane protease YdiL (CAAX protease family)|nr:CPBP family intramembrane metalloprotease [Dysgonamonadaceae bacterium]